MPAEQHKRMVFTPWQLWQPWKKLIFALFCCPSVSCCFFCPNLHFRWFSFSLFCVKQPSDFIYLWSIMVSSGGLNDSLFLLRAHWSTAISCWNLRYNECWLVWRNLLYMSFQQDMIDGVHFQRISYLLIHIYILTSFERGNLPTEVEYLNIFRSSSTDTDWK